MGWSDPWGARQFYNIVFYIIFLKSRIFFENLNDIKGRHENFMFIKKGIYLF